MNVSATPGELEYLYAQTLLGKAYKIFAASSDTLTINSTLSDWEAAELPSVNGYLAATGTIGSGTYDANTGKFAGAKIQFQFKGTGAGFQYNALIIKVAGRTKPRAVQLYDVPIVLAAGQAKGHEYTFSFKL